MNPTPRLRLVVAALALGTLSGALRAEERGEHRRREPGPGAGMRLDDRYHHDHYYPGRGAAMRELPRGSVGIGFRDGPYFFNGGVWYRPHGRRYIVVAPPVGIFLPLLPPAYVTLWIGGAPYYYANGVYYGTAPGGYVVVDPPPGADEAQPAPPPPPPPAAPPPAPDPVIYPRNGQSAQQTEADRQDCNRWATTQPSAMADALVFQRAVAACMDGRGYTLR